MSATSLVSNNNQTFGTVDIAMAWCRSDRAPIHTVAELPPFSLIAPWRLTEKATYAIAATPYLPTFAALTVLSVRATTPAS